MSGWPLTDGHWTLERATERDFDELMQWFPDAASVDLWGGPGFRYPFSRDTFREDCRIEIMESYALRNGGEQLAAFGQSCLRDGRGHLARIVANPKLRRQGAGKQLVRMIMRALGRDHDFDEYSLFVYRDNLPARQCYRSLGFIVRDYPMDAPMPEQCYFLTKKTTRRQS